MSTFSPSSCFTYRLSLNQILQLIAHFRTTQHPTNLLLPLVLPSNPPLPVPLPHHHTHASSSSHITYHSTYFQSLKRPCTTTTTTTLAAFPLLPPPCMLSLDLAVCMKGKVLSTCSVTLPSLKLEGSGPQEDKISALPHPAFNTRDFPVRHTPVPCVIHILPGH